MYRVHTNSRGINSRCSKLLVSAFICTFSPVLRSYGPTKGIFVLSKKKKTLVTVAKYLVTDQVYLVTDQVYLVNTWSLTRYTWS